MIPFSPKKIFIHQEVKDERLTKRVLKYFDNIPYEIVNDDHQIKKAENITEAKKNLYITKHQGEMVKSCQGMGDYVCCNYFTVSFVSNCHLECSYCILQDYLKNNPIITFYANTDDILNEIDQKISKHPDQIFRVGTGELADSLALDEITGISEIIVPFAAKRKNLVVELKTKSNIISNLTKLDHQGKTVISWSINPQNFIDQEEAKTASLKERFQAASTITDYGYPIAFHLDPLLALPNWKKEYEDLIYQIKNQFDPQSIAWISMGSLRFTKELQKIARMRFPKSKIFYGELIPSQDGKMRYFREIREEIYQHVKQLLDGHLPKVPNYLCMETKKVWSKLLPDQVPNQQQLENYLSQRFEI